MSTRGSVGFTIDGKDYLSYNHSDSYPEGLGTDTVEEFRQLVAERGLDQIADRIRNLKPVSDDVPPTEEDVKALSAYTNLNVSDQSETDWYCLLRNTQGTIKGILESGYMLVNNTFINDSLFCEYAYILNFDTYMFEVYKGFQKAPHAKGRFASNPDDGNYYPCALVGEFPFEAVLSEYFTKNVVWGFATKNDDSTEPDLNHPHVETWWINECFPKIMGKDFDEHEYILANTMDPKVVKQAYAEYLIRKTVEKDQKEDSNW